MNIKYNKDDIIDHNSVGAIVWDNRGRVLVLDHKKYGFYTLPIGKAYLNENSKMVMIKELYEECNIKVKKLKEIRRIKQSEIRNNKKVNMEIILFEIIEWSGMVYNKEPNKHKNITFLSIDELLEKTKNGENTSWITEMFLEDYVNKKVGVL